MPGNKNHPRSFSASNVPPSSSSINPSDMNIRSVHDSLAAVVSTDPNPSAQNDTNRSSFDSPRLTINRTAFHLADFNRAFNTNTSTPTNTVHGGHQQDHSKLTSVDWFKSMLPGQNAAEGHGHGAPSSGYQSSFSEKTSPGPARKELGLSQVRRSEKKSGCSPCDAKSFAKKQIKTFLPITDWLFNYNFKSDLLNDVICGITVAFFQVPQSMGYCLIAHVPPVHGLYTAFFPALIYSFLGTSKHAAVGAFAIVSGVMTGNLVTAVFEHNGHQPLSDGHSGHPDESYSTVPSMITSTHSPPNQYPIPNLTEIEVATVASLIMGFMVFILGILRIGSFVSMYLSDQMISGFSCAASAFVFTSQLRHLTGVKYKFRVGLFNLPLAYYDLFYRWKEIHNLTIATSVVTIFVLCLFKLGVISKLYQKVAPKFVVNFTNKYVMFPFPIDLLVVIFGVIISAAFDFEGKKVKIIGHLEQGLPEPELPRLFELGSIVWPKAIPLAAVGFTISLSIGKIFGAKHKYEIDPNQECLALGVCNIISSLFSCLPCAASLPRSAVQEGAGGRTQLVSLVNCLALLFVIYFVGSYLEKLPDCMLASIIAVALIGLLRQMKEFKRLWSVSKLDGSIWLVSFLAVLILDVDIGLYTGLAYSLIILIFKSSRPKTYILAQLQLQPLLDVQNQNKFQLQPPGKDNDGFHDEYEMDFNTSGLRKRKDYQPSQQLEQLSLEGAKKLQKMSHSSLSISVITGQPMSDVYLPIKSGPGLVKMDGFTPDEVLKELPGIKIYQFCGPLHFSSVDFFLKDIRKKTIAPLLSRMMVDGQVRQESRAPSNGIKSYKTFESVNGENNNANHVFDALEILANTVTHVIVDCSMISYVDSSGISALKKTYRSFSHINLSNDNRKMGWPPSSPSATGVHEESPRGIRVFLANLADHVIIMMERVQGFFDEDQGGIPQTNVFLSIHDAVLTAQHDQKKELFFFGSS